MQLHDLCEQEMKNKKLKAISLNIGVTDGVSKLLYEIGRAHV